MLAWTISEHETGKIINSLSCTADAKPLEELVLIDASKAPLPEPQRVFCVELVLVDWASVFEMEAVCVQSTVLMSRQEDSIHPFPTSIPHETHILLVGDSISCGYAIAPEDGGQPIPRGYCDAFPYIAMNLLRQRGHKAQVDTIAYPGVTLTKTEDSSLGMGEMFFQISPWDRSPYKPLEHPSLIVIALGTNDEAQDVDHNHFLATLNDFIQRLCKGFDNVTDVCIIPPFPDFSEQSDPQLSLASRIRQVPPDIKGVQAQDGPIFPPIHVLDVIDGLNITHTVDGLHPTFQGHQVLGHNLAERLDAILSLPGETE
ncbi:SGNH hydrolase-type esterase domain-containing protein [Phlebopus sp. FC_14]|nr:SGNH hydrolase-type esterase domain-containing protein [Phlebopus sp. FC_14]